MFAVQSLSVGFVLKAVSYVVSCFSFEILANVILFFFIPTDSQPARPPNISGALVEVERDIIIILILAVE